MNDIQRIIHSHMMEVDTALSQILFDLIVFNKIIERSLSNASQLMEDDTLSELFIDLAWEKNLLTKQLKDELMCLEDIMIDIIDLEQFLLDFGKIEEHLINTDADDMEYLENAMSKTEILLINYGSVIEINDLPVRTVNLLKSQRDKIKQGLYLIQGYYAKELI